jgi:hypothetical protein
MHLAQLQAIYHFASVILATLVMHLLHVKELQLYPPEFLQREETLASRHHVEQMHFVLKEILQQHVLASKIILEIHMLHVDQSVPSMQIAPLIRHARD